MQQIAQVCDYDLSIVIPIYNGEKYIVPKLESVSKIKNLNYEIIISLNLSTDKSEQLVDIYSRQFANLKVIKHSSYLEVEENFQIAVANANGMYICLTAVDDILDKEFFQEAIDILKEKPHAVAVAPLTQFGTKAECEKLTDFELTGKPKDRLRILIPRLRVAHNIFYSLMPRAVAITLYQNFKRDNSFIGGDWFFDINLALMGEVYRTKSSKCIIGMDGISRTKSKTFQEELRGIRKNWFYFDLSKNILRLVTIENRVINVLLLKFIFSLLFANIHRFLMKTLKY